MKRLTGSAGASGSAASTAGLTGLRRAVGAGVVIAAGLLLGACRTSVPATIVLPAGQVLRGSATTSVNGQYAVSNGSLNCTGTYDGRTLVGVSLTYKRRAPVTVQCSNGKTGSSQDALWDTQSAALTFSDGSKGRITLGGAGDR